MKPGATTIPVASNTSAEGALIAGATCAIRSPSSRTSSIASVPRDGSSTRPFLTSSIGGILGLRWGDSAGLGLGTSDQLEQQGHAHRQPVGDLFEHARLRAIKIGRASCRERV